MAMHGQIPIEFGMVFPDGATRPTMTTMARPGRSFPLANCTLIARRAATTVKQRGPGARTLLLTWAFVVERVTGIEPALSAWEVCGAAARLPADRLTCGSTVLLSVSDRGFPRWLLRSGT